MIQINQNVLFIDICCKNQELDNIGMLDMGQKVNIRHH